MNKAEAIRAYAKTNYSELVESYLNADKYYISNKDDKNLIPIYIPLPNPPKWELIDGFGKLPEEQFFMKREKPEQVKELEAQFDTIDEVWEELRQNYPKYKKVFKFIQDEIYYELNGYWFFNNGTPTYISGTHYVMLNEWQGPDGYMQYRDRDREWFLFADYMARLSNFMGFNTPKPRRCGDTTKASVYIYLRMSRAIKANSGLQSKTDTHAKEVFEEHYVEPWRGLSFWLKPLHSGTDDPKSGFNFVPPANTATKNKSTGKKGAILAKSRGLESKVTFGASGVHVYDTWRLHDYHGDEVGKTKDVNIYKRTMVVRKSLSLGTSIIGFMVNTSTVNEMLKEGGKNFGRLCEQSMFHDAFKNPSGRTTTWLATLFQPATRGLTNFVGKYGEGIIDTPTPQQIEFSKKHYPKKQEEHHYIGSYEFLMNERKSLQAAGDVEGLNEEIRMNPIEYRECWKKSVTDSGFPVNRMEDRIIDLGFIKQVEDTPIKIGDFVPEDIKNPDSDIIFVEHPNGKFEVSYLFPEKNMANRKVKVKGQWTPVTTEWGIAGGDDFQPKKVEGRRMSDGSGAVFMYKTRSDSQKENIEEMEGGRFVCVYRYRPPTIEEYCEDMLSMIRYYGVLYFPENNIYESVRHIIKRGYAGFLKYAFDVKQGKFKTNAGWANTGDTPKRVWNKLRDYFNCNAEREMHIDLLQEGVDIDGIEQFTDYDLLVASGSCLLGAEDLSMEEATGKSKEKTDIGNFFSKKHKTCTV